LVTGVQSENNEITLNAFYPNPSENGIYHVDLELKNLKVYNGMGELVSALQTTNTLNLSTQPKGVYMVYFNTNNGVYKQKLSLK
jgi:hypothetical protein